MSEEAIGPNMKVLRECWRLIRREIIPKNKNPG
jgi:hypothetical protein